MRTAIDFKAGSNINPETGAPVASVMMRITDGPISVMFVMGAEDAREVALRLTTISIQAEDSFND